MTRQLALGDPELPPAFVEAWLHLERKHKVNADIRVVEVVRKRFGVTIALRIDGKTYAVINRANDEAAARDLFAQAFPAITTKDNAHV
jgi:hypothetical protein